MFVDNGVLDFHRMPLVVLGGLEYAVPDFVVEPPNYRLRSNSPAIDAGTCANAPATDMGGAPRPQGMGCDMGAYEYPGPMAVAFVRGDANGDGRVDISDAVRVLEFLFAGREAPSCLKSADATGDGAVNIADPIHLLSYLFRGEPVLPAPFPECGFADTADPLSCERHEPCEG